MRKCSIRQHRALALVAIAAGLSGVCIAVIGCGGGGGAPSPPTEAVVSGSVVDATDTSSPIPNARVSLTNPTSSAARGTRALLDEDTTDQDGNYTLRTRATGEVELRVDAIGSFSGVAILIDITGRASVDIRITLLPTSRTVSKVLVKPPGPLTVRPGDQLPFVAQVLDDGDDPMTDVTPTWAVSGRIGTIDASGIFTAGSVAASGHVVAVAGDKAGVVDVTVETGDQPPGSVNGTVIDLETQNPIVGALVTISGRADVTDSSGDFLVTGLNNGPQTLTASAESQGYLPTSVEVDVQGATALLAPIQLVPLSPGPPPPPGTITGTVTLNGSLPPGGTITVEAVNQAAGPPPVGSATLTAPGAYGLLVPGGAIYTVTASATGFQPDSQTVALPNLGDTASGVDFTLSP